MKGRGIGSRMLRYVESLYPVTMVGVVSCRTDILPFYTKRGYNTFAEEEFDSAGLAELSDITRRGLKYVKKQKINNVDEEMIKVMQASHADMETVMDVVNSGYAEELGNATIAFKKSNKFETLEEVLAMRDDLYVAKVGFEIVGVIGIGKINSSYLLGTLAVRKDLQGYGVGGALLQYAQSRHERN